MPGRDGAVYTGGMNTSALVWVVDDDPELRTLLAEYLAREQFDVRTFPDAADVLRRLPRERPDLIVLDLMMPGEDGLSVCRRIRAAGDEVPIIMLTARADPVDRVIGIETGADDYLGKPFLPRELSARIHAVLRRRRAPLPGAPLPDSEVVSFGDCRLDLSSRSLFRAGARVELTTGEFGLLAALARHPHQPLTRERLIELARGPESDTNERSMDVQISRLRRLIEPNPVRPRHIQTVWGVGYVFVPETGEGVV